LAGQASKKLFPLMLNYIPLVGMWLICELEKKRKNKKETNIKKVPGATNLCQKKIPRR
jgi:hypothetical protein